MERSGTSSEAAGSGFERNANHWRIAVPCDEIHWLRYGPMRGGWRRQGVADGQRFLPSATQWGIGDGSKRRARSQ